MTNNDCIIISIEGNIGAGKSTIVSSLEELVNDNMGGFIANKRVIFLQEPVDEWLSLKDNSGENILSKFYKDQKKHAFAFQMMAYISRQSLLNKTIKENPNCVIITERCIHTDKNVFAKMLFDDNKISKIEYEIYNKWFNEFAENTHYSSHIYINVDYQTSKRRIKNRNRKGEDIPSEYLKNCEKYHNEWLTQLDNTIYIEMNEDCVSNNAPVVIKECKKIIRSVKDLVMSNGDTLNSSVNLN
jgi:deoxyadenosine/deoxycytidine kinase